MGALPHMAVLARERPILVATPWVLVPKGVQVHRPPGNGHRASHNRPTGQSPNGEEDTSDRPGMPGHWAPATWQSPTTGQMGKKETYSLPSPGTDQA